MTIRCGASLFAAAALVAGCSTLDDRRDRAPADDSYARQLIGTWSSEHVDSSGRLAGYSEKTYHADGTANGFIVFPASVEAGACSALRKLTFESRWKVVGDIVETTDVDYAPTSLNEEKGEASRQRIISIDEHEARFEDLSDHSRFTRKRVR